MKIGISDLTNEERDQFDNEVEGDKAGFGVVHTGKYHVLTYCPVKSDGEDVGVAILLNKMESRGSTLLSRNEILYELPWYYQPKESFENRLESIVKPQISLIVKLDKDIDDEISRVIKEKAEREQAIKDYTEQARLRRLKIDSSIKTIVPKAKSMIECNNERLLAEAESKNFISNMKITESFFDIPEEEEFVECPENVSDFDKQKIVNDMMMNSNKKKMCGKNNSKIVVDTEVILPNDSRYLTDVEKQNMKKYSGFYE